MAAEVVNLEELPYELAYKYMLYLDWKSLQNMCRLNKTYTEICRDNYFWNSKIEVDFPEIIGNYDRSDAKQWWIHCTVSARCFVYLQTQVDFKPINFGEDSYYDNKWQQYQGDNYINEELLKYYKEGVMRSFDKMYRKNASPDLPKVNVSKRILLFIKNGNILVGYIRFKKVGGKVRKLGEMEKEACQETFQDIFDYEDFNNEDITFHYSKLFGPRYLVYGADFTLKRKSENKPNPPKHFETVYQVEIVRTINISYGPPIYDYDEKSIKV